MLQSEAEHSTLCHTAMLGGAMQDTAQQHSLVEQEAWQVLAVLQGWGCEQQNNVSAVHEQHMHNNNRM